MSNMKKILTTMSILGFSTVTITNVVACSSPIAHDTIKPKNDGHNWYSPNKMENIIKDINNTITPKKGWVEEKLYDLGDLSMNGLVQSAYTKFFNNKNKGTIKLIKTIPKEENVLETFENSYSNNSDSEQVYQTQSYSKDITNTSTFSWKLSEKVSIKTSWKIPFIGAEEINVELGAEQQWTNTKITTEKITNPNQPFKVKPHSLGTVLYTIKQGIYKNEGKISYSVNLNDTIASSYYWSESGTWTKVNYTIKDIIKLLVEHGYKDQLKMDFDSYSIISTDNPDNPKNVFLNLPISWQSEGGKMNVTFDEKPI